MGSRALVNIIMLAAVLGLAALVYFSSLPPAEPDLQRLTGLTPETVKQLRLERDTEALSFVRGADGRWQMQTPVVVAANPVLLQRMLAAFGLQSQQRYPLVETELKKYGLDTPPVRLEADGQALVFGRLNPLNSLRYVQLDNQVHMVAENDIAFLQQDWPSYVTSTLLPAQAPVVSLAIEGLGALKSSDTGWQYTGGYAPHSADQMQALVDAWQAAQGVSVTALTEQVVTALGGINVEVVLANDELLRFVLVKQAEQWLVIRPELGLAYHITDAGELLEWPSLDAELE